MVVNILARPPGVWNGERMPQMQAHLHSRFRILEQDDLVEPVVMDIRIRVMVSRVQGAIDKLLKHRHQNTRLDKSLQFFRNRYRLRPPLKQSKLQEPFLPFRVIERHDFSPLRLRLAKMRSVVSSTVASLVSTTLWPNVLKILSACRCSGRFSSRSLTSLRERSRASLTSSLAVSMNV